MARAAVHPRAAGSRSLRVENDTDISEPPTAHRDHSISTTSMPSRGVAQLGNHHHCGMAATYAALAPSPAAVDDPRRCHAAERGIALQDSVLL